MAWVRNSYNFKEFVATGASNAALTDWIPCADGASSIIVEVIITSGTGTLKIQDAASGAAFPSVKAKTVAITGAGTFRLTLFPYLVADQANYPIGNQFQVVVDTTLDLVVSSVSVVSER